MNKCPSIHIVETYFTGDTVSIENKEHINACAKCQTILKEIGLEKEQLLRKIPPSVLEEAVKEKRKPIFNIFNLLSTAGAVAVLLVAFYFIFKPAIQEDEKLIFNPLIQRDLQIKGKGIITEFVVKRGEDQRPVKEDDIFQEGDAIRIIITNDESGYVSLFSVDESGKIFEYYKNTELASGKSVLPGSIVLDNSKLKEKMFLLICKKTISIDQLTSMILKEIRANKKLEIIHIDKVCEYSKEILIRK